MGGISVNNIEDCPVSVLAVDDEPMVLACVKRSLTRNKDFLVITAESAQEALEKVSQNSPDLVLMDINLAGSDMDGIECIRRMRSQGYTGNIFILTGSFSTEKLINAALSGADDFIIKGPIPQFSTQIKELYIHKKKATHQKNKTFDPRKESGLLRSFLKPEQINLLSEFADRDYPQINKLAKHLKTTESALWKRMSRIREKMNLTNMEQIAEVMTSIKFLGKK